MATRVTVASVDRTSVTLFRTAKIVLPGPTQKVGRADFEIIDKTLALTFAKGDAVVWDDDVTSEVFFDGKLSSVKRRSMHGPPASRKVTHVLVASDNNTVADERVVGAPTGQLWVGPDAQGNFVEVDPSANTSSTDKATVAALFGAYVTNPVMDATTFVEEFIGIGENIIYWDRMYLRAVLDQLAAFAGVNVVWWIDGTDVHYTRLTDPSDPEDPEAYALLFPTSPIAPDEAPYEISDEPDGVTLVGSMVSEYEEDAGSGGTAPQNVYVRGATGTIRDEVGNPVYGGTGWYPDNSRDPWLRQIMIDVPNADTVAKRDAAAARVVSQVDRGNRRGSSVVTGFDGWRGGQTVRITDAALALDSARFPIQRVTLTFPTPDDRRYRIEWGDASTRRFSEGLPLQKATQVPGAAVGIVPPATPAHTVYVYPLTPTPIPGSTEVVIARLINGAGQFWRIQGKTVTWELITTDEADVVVTGEGSISPGTSDTDAEGKALTEITYGTTTGIYYRVKGTVEVI